MKKRIKLLFSLPFAALLLIISVYSCEMKTEKKDQSAQTIEPFKHADWSVNANIYEVNIRQYTAEGTINAFRGHMPRLKEMGVDILWLMPIFPIGELNRKGSLGSYYSISDYKSVNPEFGTMDDIKALVQEAHDLNMHVILDWVANHSSWDNPMAIEHPEYYQRNDDGTFISPFDWTDVIAFDYSNPAMRDSMVSALKFWVTEVNVDGYRCDVAGMVPVDFWNDAVKQLKQIKPVFMLAEDEENVQLLEEAFDMNYSWKLFNVMHDIAEGKKNASGLWKYLKWNDSIYDANTYRMNFTANHDENSWNGTTEELFGKGAETFAVLTYTIPGMPLIYGGQEAGLNKRLRFFEKDTIDWSNLPYADFYRTLNNLKTRNKALWNGTAGGKMMEISKGQNPNVFAFSREKDGDKVLVLLNLSAEKQAFTIDRELFTGTYSDVFLGEEVVVAKNQEFELLPWKYIVLESSAK